MIPLLAALAMSSPLEYPLIPAPQELKLLEGAFRMPAQISVDGFAGFPKEREALQRALKDAGVRVTRGGDSSSNPGLTLRLDPGIGDRPGAYRLDVAPDGIRIHGRDRAGAFWAVQTLRQMLMGRGRAPFELPAVSIVDAPRFEWRGMLLDVSRHFFTPQEIKSLLDRMSELKLNVFHWHLTDDGGWRMEVKKHPKLTDKGAWRTDISRYIWDQGRLEFPGRESGTKLEGGFYTLEEIRDIVAYAADRHITIVPEIEIPGHSLAAVESYPEIGCDIDKLPGHAYRTNVYCAGKESAFQFIRDVLDETLALFPSKVIHIGGDEVDKGYWSRCPRCREWMALRGLKGFDELQSDLIKRVEVYLNSKGRTMIGWDEILEGGLAPNAMVMSWRGEEGGIAAAKAGHDVVMSPTSHCYFDYSYETTSTEEVYHWEPVPKALSEAEANHVKGGQANVWTEWITTLDRIEFMIFPRILAAAEALWTRPESRYWPSFQRRLEPHLARYLHDGVDFHIGRPTFEANLIVFKDACEVRLEGTEIRGIPLRYSTDGKSPTSSSPEWKGSLKVDRSMVIAAAYLRGNKLVEQPTRVVCLKGAPKASPTPGLTYRLSKERFMTMPDWDALKDLADGRSERFDIAPFASMDTFGIQWKGSIRIEREGLYTFTIGSDDGSVLDIAGARIVDNDGPHAFLERSGKAYLLPGVYPIEVGFFESGGDERFEAWVEGPELRKTRLEELLARS